MTTCSSIQYFKLNKMLKNGEDKFKTGRITDSKFEQMIAIQSFCKDELDLLQNNIKLFLKQCEHKNNILRKLVVNSDAMYVLDRHITELTNVLNLARKFNIAMEADECTSESCMGNGACAGTAFNVCYNNVLLQNILRCGNTEHNNNCAKGLKNSLISNIDLTENLEICDEDYVVNGRPSFARNNTLKAIKDSDSNAKYSSENKRTSLSTSNNNIARSKLEIQCVLNRELPKKKLDHYIRSYEFNASITYVQDYAKFIFYVCPMDDYDKLFQFRKISNMQAIDNYNIPEHTVLCVTKNNGEDWGILWRAIINPQINDVIKENSIYLVDYGEVLSLKNNDTGYRRTLYKLPPEYQHIPPLAIKCILDGVLTVKGVIKSEPTYLEMTLRQYECKAVKLQVAYRVGYDLHVILKESVKDQCQQYQISDTSFNSVKMESKNPFLNASDFNINKQCDFAMSSEKQLSELSLNEKLPVPLPLPSKENKKEEFLRLIVTHVDTPLTFWAIREHHSLFWEDDEISIIQKQFTAQSQPKVDDIVLSQYTKDGYWYRAKVLHIHNEKHTYQVIYIDYGNVEIVPLSCIAKCTEDQLKSPGLAIHCRLANLTENIDQNTNYEQQMQYEKALGAVIVLILNKIIQLKVVQNINGNLAVQITDPLYADLPQTLLNMGVVKHTNV